MREKHDLFVMFLSVALFFGLILLNVIALRADEAVNLKVLGDKAQNKNIPIMLLFVDDDCDDCLLINEEVIIPMQISGDYNNKVIIQIISMDADKLTDFNSEIVSIDNFSNRYDLELTPSVSFVDGVGNKLLPSISGLSNLEYYGSLLDEALEKALLKLHDD
ncbi:MAG: hypothetical protein IME94_01940 [Proteobacteria bacterium]|nr:hypothetical protein [Pseudomonadota bacterium]